MSYVCRVSPCPASTFPHSDIVTHNNSATRFVSASFIFIMRGVVLFFLWHSSSLIKSWISFTSPLLPSVFRNFIIWPPFRANSLAISVYIARFSVFVSILRLPYPVSFFITFFCILFLFLFLDNYNLFIFYILYVFQLCIYLLLYYLQSPSIIILFPFLPLPYLPHLLTSVLFLCFDSSSYLFLVVHLFFLSFFFPLFVCLCFVFILYLFIITSSISAVQVERMRVRFPLGSLVFFIDLILPVAL